MEPLEELLRIKGRDVYNLNTIIRIYPKTCNVACMNNYNDREYYKPDSDDMVPHNKEIFCQYDEFKEIYEGTSFGIGNFLIDKIEKKYNVKVCNGYIEYGNKYDSDIYYLQESGRIMNINGCCLYGLSRRPKYNKSIFIIECHYK